MYILPQNLESTILHETLDSIVEIIFQHHNLGARINDVLQSWNILKLAITVGDFTMIQQQVKCQQ